VFVDARIGLGGGDDGGRRERLGEVDVGALPRSHRFAVDGEVILDPGSDRGVAPGVERNRNRRRVGAAIEQVQQAVDLHAGHRHAAPGGRCRRGHRVTDRHQARPAALAAVDVPKAATDQHATCRRGEFGVGPIGQAGDGAARGVERLRVAKQC